MCTGVRFSDQYGNMYFGRNLDWSEGYGQKVIITPRGYKYSSAFLGDVSNHKAIIGMGIIVDNTPLYFDCANEGGLAIAGLNFPGYAAYSPAPIADKTNVAAYEFPLWITRNFTTIEEVKAALRDVTIVARPINDKYPVSELHWIIGDSLGSIVVEYTNQGMQIYDNDIDVLTNQPDYTWHKENLRNYMNLFSKLPENVKWGKSTIMPFGSGSLMRGLPGDYYSPSRFVRAAYFNSHYPVQPDEASNISRLFHTLNGVAMIDGASMMIDGAYEKTIYTGGFSSATQTYYYSTYDNPDIQKVTMTNYELDSTELITA